MREEKGPRYTTNVFIALFLVLGAFTLHVYFSEKQLQPTKEKQRPLTSTSLRRNAQELLKNNDGKEEESKEESEILSPLDQKYDPESIPTSEENEHDEEGAEPNVDGNEQDVNQLSKYEQQALDLKLTKSAIAQSSLYIFAFMIVYSSIIIALLSGSKQSQVIFWWVSIFFPLGGMFNMIIYTKPKVQAVKKTIPPMPRIVCFILVLLSGGETPNLMDLMASQEERLPSRPPTNLTSRLARAFGFSAEYDLDAEIETAMREIAVD